MLAVLDQLFKIGIKYIKVKRQKAVRIAKRNDRNSVPMTMLLPFFIGLCQMDIFGKDLYVNYIVISKNLSVKSTAITVTTISFFVYLPVTSLMITYAIAPIAIPLDIE